MILIWKTRFEDLQQLLNLVYRCFWEYHKKKVLQARIGGIQKSLVKFRLRHLIELEKELQVELEGVLDNEELLWKQKSRSEWLSLGNCNTKYFHCQATKRGQVNQIKSLKLEDDLWCYDERPFKTSYILLS